MTNSRSGQPRSIFGVCFLVLLILCLGTAWPATLAAGPLTLTRVVLSTGGVGYFEYQANVDGDAELSLAVRLDQVDDVLKSIVVYDDRGGTGSVRLPGREPLAQIFRDLPFGPEAFASPAALLNALQGAEIRVVGARRIQGRLVSVVPEASRLPDGLGTITRHRVSLMTDEGLLQFILEDAEALQFVDTELQAQVETGLAAIATHRARDRRVLEIAAKGQGRRILRVAYVVAVPLWKISYRLTLGPEAAADARASLQGWAVVENMSGQDWKGIELTLVSGNPVTFRQAIYTAYYVDRPEVPVEVLGRVLPRPDEGIIAGARAQAQLRRELGRKAEGEAAPDVLAEAMQAVPTTMAGLSLADLAPGPALARLAAEAEEAATQVVFRFPHPISVRTGHSLMVPIIDREVPVERMALYQPATHERHPLATVRLTNDGETGLPPGVLTLYERTGTGGAVTFIGDARLSVLPGGEERLVSFALDQKTRIDREVKSRQTIAKGRINRGIFEVTILDEQTTIYRLKGPAREDRLVLIEHPRQPGWTLAVPDEKDTVLTAEHYRIRHRLSRGGEDRLEVTLERPRLEKIQLIQLSTARLAGYAKTGELDEALRRAFARMGELRAEIDRHRRRLDELDEKRRQIFDEQTRIRDNLAQVPSNSDLYHRYLNKLNSQEDELERILALAKTTRQERNRARDALSDYIGGLEL